MCCKNSGSRSFRLINGMSVCSYAPLFPIGTMLYCLTLSTTRSAYVGFMVSGNITTTFVDPLWMWMYLHTDLSTSHVLMFSQVTINMCAHVCVCAKSDNLLDSSFVFVPFLLLWLVADDDDDGDSFFLLLVAPGTAFRLSVIFPCTLHTPA